MVIDEKKINNEEEPKKSLSGTNVIWHFKNLLVLSADQVDKIEMRKMKKCGIEAENQANRRLLRLIYVIHDNLDTLEELIETSNQSSSTQESEKEPPNKNLTQKRMRNEGSNDEDEGAKHHSNKKRNLNETPTKIKNERNSSQESHQNKENETSNDEAVLSDGDAASSNNLAFSLELNDEMSETDKLDRKTETKDSYLSKRKKVVEDFLSSQGEGQPLDGDETDESPSLLAGLSHSKLDDDKKNEENNETKIENETNLKRKSINSLSSKSVDGLDNLDSLKETKTSKEICSLEETLNNDNIDNKLKVSSSLEDKAQDSLEGNSKNEKTLENGSESENKKSATMISKLSKNDVKKSSKTNKPSPLRFKLDKSGQNSKPKSKLERKTEKQNRLVKKSLLQSDSDSDSDADLRKMKATKKVSKKKKVYKPKPKSIKEAHKNKQLSSSIVEVNRLENFILSKIKEEGVIYVSEHPQFFSILSNDSDEELAALLK